jgi:hypothetical protein
MLNVIFVTFTYGMAIPLLFPIAFIYFAVSNIVERLALAYSYRKPPMFDDQLNRAALSYLKVAPLFMMLFGYWSLGNNQIFGDLVSGRLQKTDPVITDHTGIDISPRKPSFVLLLMTGALVIFLLFTGIIKKMLIACHIMSADANIDVNERLGTYAQSLNEASRKVWLIEQKHLKELVGCQTISEEF